MKRYTSGGYGHTFSFGKPQSPRDWRSFGAFSAFIVALFTEMYGFPLTIYLLSGWLQTRYPGIDLMSHNAGHLWSTLFGLKGDPHFGVLHLAFNLLWYWEFGRRLERVRGRMTALAVLLITGAGGNIAQYIIDGDVLFGGLSGVIYGLLGYAWMWTRLSGCLLYTSPSPRDRTRSRMPSSA